MSINDDLIHHNVIPELEENTDDEYEIFRDKAQSITKKTLSSLHANHVYHMVVWGAEFLGKMKSPGWICRSYHCRLIQ